MTDESIQILPVSSQKEMIVRTASKILEKWDAQFADYVYNGIKYNTVYTSYAEMYFIANQFKDEAPVDLQTSAGVEFTFDYTINDGLRYKDFVVSLKELVGGAILQSYIMSEAKNTHLEQLYSDVEELNYVIAQAIKYATGQVKIAFKHWANLLSAAFEADYNLVVETCDINSELRIIGLWTLDEHRNKKTEFYINPDYLADSLNSKMKVISKFSKNAYDLSETMNAVKEGVIHSRIALGIAASLSQIPDAISATKLLVTSCNTYTITEGKVPKAPTAISAPPPSKPVSESPDITPLPPPMSIPEEI